MVTLGAYLKRIRLQQGLSLKDVYKKTGISDSKLSRIENGANVSETAPSILQGLSKPTAISTVSAVEASFMKRSVTVSWLSSVP